MFGLKTLIRSLQTKSFSSMKQHDLGPANWSARDGKAFANEGYSKNTIVYRCVDLLSSGIASIPVKVVSQNGKHLKNHALQKLIDEPNPMQSWEELVKEFISFNRITGNAYQEVITNGIEEPTELWNWQPYQMKAEGPADARMPYQYKWREGTQEKTWKVDKLDGSSNMLHWKTFGPIAKWIGMSPLEAAAWAVDQHNSAGEWNQRLLQNSARPPGAFVSEDKMSDPQYERFKRDLESNYSGPSAAGRPMVLEGRVSWVSYGLNPTDMDWLEGKNGSARETASVYGVPTQVVPIQGDQTFANYNQARLALWEDTLIPLGQSFLKAFSRFIRKYYKDGDRISLQFDLDDVIALETRRTEVWANAEKVSYLTPNEKRDIAGRDPYDSTVEKENTAEQLWVKSGMLPIDDADMSRFGQESEDEESEEESDEPVEEDSNDDGGGGSNV